MMVAWHDSELKRWHVCVSVFMVKKWYFSISQKWLWILLVSYICFWIGSLMLANHHDGNGKALRSLMRNLSCPAFWGKISTFVICLYCKCLYIYKYLYLVFSPYPQIALPLLGDIGALFKVFCCHVRNCVLISRKNQKGNLYQRSS